MAGVFSSLSKMWYRRPLSMTSTAPVWAGWRAVCRRQPVATRRPNTGARPSFWRWPERHRAGRQPVEPARLSNPSGSIDAYGDLDSALQPSSVVCSRQELTPADRERNALCTEEHPAGLVSDIGVCPESLVSVGDDRHQRGNRIGSFHGRSLGQNFKTVGSVKAVPVNNRAGEVMHPHSVRTALVPPDTSMPVQFGTNPRGQSVEDRGAQQCNEREQKPSLSKKVAPC